MPPFTARLSEGFDRAVAHLPLALVPLVTALLATDKIRKVALFDGRHFGLRLGLPVGVVDMWQFVSVPNETAGVGLPLPESLPLAAVLIPLGIVVQAALASAYFGSLREALEIDTFDFVANLRRYFGPFLVYTVLPMLVVLPLALLELSGRRLYLPLLVLLVPAFLVAAYLFYATPYLIVLRDVGLLPAARRSFALAVAGGAYFRFAAGYVGFVLGLSLLATAVVVNLGLFGVAIGALGLAPVGLAANATAMRFVADIDPGSPSLGEWDGQSARPGEP